jgi:hypothetical protein
MKKVLLTVGFFSLLSVVPHYSLATSTPVSITDEGQAIDKSGPQWKVTVKVLNSHGISDDGSLDLAHKAGFALFTGAIAPATYAVNFREFLAMLQGSCATTKRDLHSPTSPPFTPSGEFRKSLRDRISEFSTLEKGIKEIESYLPEAKIAESVFAKEIQDARKALERKQTETKETEALIALSKANKNLERGVTIDAQVRALTALGSDRTSKQTLELNNYKAWLEVLGTETFSGREISSDIAESTYRRLQVELKKAEEDLETAQRNNEKRAQDISDETDTLKQKTDARNILAEQIRHKLTKVLREVSKLKGEEPTPDNSTKIATRVEEMKDAKEQLERAGLSLVGNASSKGKLFTKGITAEPPLTLEMAREIELLTR